MREVDTSFREERSAANQPSQAESAGEVSSVGGRKATISSRDTQGKYGWGSRVRSYLLFDPLIWLFTVILGIVAIPVSLFGEKERILHGFARFWSRLIMKTISSPVKVTGLEKIDTTKPHVIAVNHASAIDIPVLYVYLPFQFRIVFKKELLVYPIVGWHLRRSGQVCIDQQNPSRSIGSIRAALKGLKSGIPLVIFPEGGRTPDGELKPFLPGAFFLAIKAQVDIIPVALVGTYELLPMDTFHIKCRPMEMRVGNPISTGGYTLRDMDALSGKVHAAMEKLYYAETGGADRIVSGLSDA
jgi:1-acyl-sn-glycerol-3-phosphate acyltransferase